MLKSTPVANIIKVYLRIHTNEYCLMFDLGNNHTKMLQLQMDTEEVTI
jgi:hypothetical protein